MFNISKDKSPDPDRLNGFFFHKTWHILGVDISDAIIDFFNINQILRQINATYIAFIPKVLNPDLVKDFRSIS